MTPIQQSVHAGDQHPLQPLERLKGIQAERLGACERFRLRRSLLLQLMLAQECFDGVQLSTNAIVLRHEKPQLKK